MIRNHRVFLLPDHPRRADKIDPSELLPSCYMYLQHVRIRRVLICKLSVVSDVGKDCLYNYGYRNDACFKVWSINNSVASI